MRWTFALALAAVACGGATPKPSAPAGANAANVTAERPDDPPPRGPPVQIECGDFTTCAIVEGGAVRCWGRNKAGELGDGGGPDRTKSSIVRGVENTNGIALASHFGCALGADTKVKCWGTGLIANDGQLKEHARATPVVGLEGVEELVASGAMACARTPAAITCWGADAPTIGTPPTGTFAQIAAGITHACALDKKGAVTCWGTGDWTGPKGAFAKPPIAGATHLATGDRHACVVTKERKVQCWGLNDAGQLGTKPDAESHKTPVTVPGVTNAVKLVASEASTCAVLSDATAQCWGANTEGELGLGKKSSDERPVKLKSVPDVASMCLATTHGCALTKTKSIVCWGANAVGQLGDGTKLKEPKLEPAPVAW